MPSKQTQFISLANIEYNDKKQYSKNSFSKNAYN